MKINLRARSSHKKSVKQILLGCSVIFSLLISNTSPAAIISDLYISEVMANPAAVSDTYGEWFELYNPTTDVFDLNGILLSDSGSNNHLISSTTALLINPGDYFVLGRNGDTGINGGLDLDYVYSNFSLVNSSDDIFLTDADGNTLNFSYTSGLVLSGYSTELTGFDNGEAIYTFNQTDQYGLGDYGTPGTGNLTAPTLVTAAVSEPENLWLLLAGSLLFIRRQRKTN